MSAVDGEGATRVATTSEGGDGDGTTATDTIQATVFGGSHACFQLTLTNLHTVGFLMITCFHFSGAGIYADD